MNARRWFIRYGAPRNRFQALMCWLCGFDVYYGESHPWAQETTQERTKTPEPEAKPLPPLGKPKTGVGQWRPRERPRV